MPAANLSLLINEQDWDQFNQSLNAAFVIGTLGSGVLAQGGNVARVEGLFTALSAGALVVDDYKHELRQSEAGKNFLAAWENFHAVLAIWQAGKIIVALPEAYKSLKEAYKQLKTKNPSTAAKISKEVDELIAKGDEVIEGIVEGADAISDALRRKILKTLSKSQADELIAELGKNAALKTAMEADEALVESWKYVSDLKVSGKSKLTQDVDFLEVVHRQRSIGIVDKIGSDKYDDIIKNYAGQCKGCDAPASNASEAVKHLPPQDEMLSNLETFVNKHNGKDGIAKVLDDLKSTDPRKQKGAEFVSRILKDQDGVSVFEFKYLDDYDNTADFVLNGKNIDGKSWSVAGSIDNIGGWEFPKQLKDYLNNGSFEQWFDYSRFQKSANSTYSSMSKTDAANHIKEQYQKLFTKNNYAAYDEIASSKWLKDREILDVDDFKEAISDVSDDFYSFIKVK